MRRFLEQHGLRGISGEQSCKQLIAACCAAGAQEFQPVIVSRWNVAHSPLDSLQSWEKKPGLAGVNVPPEVKKSVLTSLSSWAVDTFGTLNKTIDSEEKYVLEGVWLSATR